MNAELPYSLVISEFPLEANSSSWPNLLAALSQPDRYVPSVYVYDDKGSALFEERCEQPEYYLRRKELEVLDECLPVLAEITGPVDLAELGCGTAVKITPILQAYWNTHGGKGDYQRVNYFPIDVNRWALEQGSRRLLELHPYLAVRGFVGIYEVGLMALPRSGRPRVYLFLGSTISNLDEPDLNALLNCLHKTLRTEDFLLVGADLIKDARIFERAYDDAQGIGRQMEMNTLLNVNRLFSGNFDLDAFDYQARYEPLLQRVDANLRSKRKQVVELKALNFTLRLEPGDSIRSGNMRKFTVEGLRRSFQARGFNLLQHWTDESAWYAVMLFKR